MNVTLLLGSIRSGRQSHRIAAYLQEQLRQRGIAADLIDLYQHPLPLMEERVGHHPNLLQEVKWTSEQLHKADALIFITPEYHGSFSGVLKNAVDYFWGEFRKKPIGVVSISAGKFGGINASTQLQHLILSLGAYPLPAKLLVPEVEQLFNSAAELSRTAFHLSANRFLDEYIWFAEAILQKKAGGIAIAEK